MAIALAVGLGGCGPAGGTGGRPSMPGEYVAGDLPMPGPTETVDEGELILRSAGEEIGRERFAMTSDGRWLTVTMKADSTFPEPMTLDLMMVVDATSWRLERSQLAIERGGLECVARQRVKDGMVELELEGLTVGGRKVVDQEPREHAQHLLALRPTISQAAICARADDEPHALEAYAPWHVVRIAPRAASTVAAASGGTLDRVRVDEAIDVYCEGRKLAIVHYPAHAFVAARPAYDGAARALAAADPVDDRWAGELACPAPQ